MSHAETNLTSVRRCFTALAVVIADFASTADAQAPQVGDVLFVPAITFSLQVGNTGKESKRATYTPPPGWYIRSHRVLCTQRHGNVSYAISTVPAGWLWSSQEQMDESRQERIEGAAVLHAVPLQGKLKLEHQEMAQERHATNSSQHALVLEAIARGEGLFRSGSGIHLSVVAELVYIGVDQGKMASPSQAVAHK
jgi:hypothetical protein